MVKVAHTHMSVHEPCCACTCVSVYADVINESSNVKVALGKDEYLAQVVGVDQDKDIAVLMIRVSVCAPVCSRARVWESVCVRERVCRYVYCVLCVVGCL